MAEQFQDLDRPTPHSHLRGLVLLAVIVIVAGALFISFFDLIFKPQFDERYAISLLARHDPSVAQAQFDPVDVELDIGEITVDGIEKTTFKTFTEPDGTLGFREADILASEDGKVISSSLIVFSSDAVPIGAEEDIETWRCADGSEINITRRQTEQYSYLAYAGDRPTRFVFDDFMEETRSNLTSKEFEQLNLSFVRGYIGKFMVSNIRYFNPDEDLLADEAANEIDAMLGDCELVIE